MRGAVKKVDYYLDNGLTFNKKIQQKGDELRAFKNKAENFYPVGKTANANTYGLKNIRHSACRRNIHQMLFRPSLATILRYAN